MEVCNQVADLAGAGSWFRIVRPSKYAQRREFFVSAPYRYNEERGRPLISIDRAEQAIVANEGHRRMASWVIVVSASRREDRVPLSRHTTSHVNRRTQPRVVVFRIVNQRVLRYSIRAFPFIFLGKLRWDRTRNIFIIRHLVVRGRIFRDGRHMFIGNVLHVEDPRTAVAHFDKPRFMILCNANVRTRIETRLRSISQRFSVREVTARMANYFREAIRYAQGGIRRHVMSVVEP